jgi:hypothetical protein
LSSNTLLAASMCPSSSVNFKTTMVLYLGSHARSSPSSRALWFQISTRWPIVISWS